MSPKSYTTQTGGAEFTVITPKHVYRVRAANEVRLRAAFEAAGIEVLAVDRDKVES